MFRKILVFAMFMTAAGYCFAVTNLPQVVTSEVFENSRYLENEWSAEYVPAWPIAGSDADVIAECGDSGCESRGDIQIVSKLDNGLTIENNFNTDFNGWSGGANMLHGNQIPVGFDDECASGYEMPLLRRELVEDDGGEVLAVSRSGHKKCGGFADGYDMYRAKVGMLQDIQNMEEKEIAVDSSADSDSVPVMSDQVRSWVVANGQTLREVLQSWCDKEGWDMVWTTSREYPIEASAVFKGRFVDVASALVRNFGRATPVPYAKFYKGNRVLVISTTEE